MRRLAGYLCLSALMLFLAMAALILLSGGRLLTGSGWRHAIWMTVAVWATFYLVGLYLDLRKIHFAKVQGIANRLNVDSRTKNRSNVILGLGVVSSIAFLASIMVALASSGSFAVEEVVILTVGLCSLIVARVLHSQRKK